MSMNSGLSKISSGYLVMLRFWDKNVKKACFQDFFRLTKFSTCSLCAQKQIGAPHNKILKTLRFVKKRKFYDFLKNRYFQKLTIDFENRTKRPAETRSCVVLDVDY